MKTLAIDHGDKKIGLAISDETGLIARPLKIIRHKSRAADAQAVADLAIAENAEQIILGLPLGDDGEDTPQSRAVRRFAEALREVCSLPLIFADESHSSTEAALLRRASGAKRKKRREPDDALAAAVVLQNYLESKKT